jgi:hypothetical protein
MRGVAPIAGDTRIAFRGLIAISEREWQRLDGGGFSQMRIKEFGLGDQGEKLDLNSRTALVAQPRSFKASFWRAGLLQSPTCCSA